ncbi:hypothetical protein FRC10_011609 [Ceratobasidium sp. 414]|nr:hypothetical protein FRC10_011609 [Ceratobasidium sp. 414]
MPCHIPTYQCDAASIMAWRGRAVTIRVIDLTSNVMVESGAAHQFDCLTLKITIHALGLNALVGTPGT